MKPIANVAADLVLAIHPGVHGFGWVIFEASIAPVDWGLASAKDNKNVRCLARIERLIDQYQPTVLVLEQFERGLSRRADRIQRLCRAVVQLAANRAIETRVYSRAVIRLCFANMGAVTRQDIAQAVATHISEFRHHLPRSRKRWETESPRMSLFSAAALAIAHFSIAGESIHPP